MVNKDVKKHERLVKIKSVLSIWWLRYVVIPIVLISPASIVTLYYIRPNIKTTIDEYLTKDMVCFLEENNLLLFFGAMILLYIFNTIYSVLETITSKKDVLAIPHTLLLLESFQKVVSSKIHRFSTELQELQKRKIEKNDSINTEQVFNTITKPDQQIIIIIHTLFYFLDSITRDIEFRVRLAEINNNKPIKWFTHAPEYPHPQTNIESLQHPDSTISTCLKSGKMEIIESIAEEIKRPKRRCVEIDGRQGSILCYPIFQQANRSYPYVISIYASRDGYFMEKKRDLYSLILDQFALRIQLEHNLLLLKELPT